MRSARIFRLSRSTIQTGWHQVVISSREAFQDLLLQREIERFRKTMHEIMQECMDFEQFFAYEGFSGAGRSQTKPLTASQKIAQTACELSALQSDIEKNLHGDSNPEREQCLLTLQTWLSVLPILEATIKGFRSNYKKFSLMCAYMPYPHLAPNWESEARRQLLKEMSENQIIRENLLEKNDEQLKTITDKFNLALNDLLRDDRFASVRVEITKTCADFIKRYCENWTETRKKIICAAEELQPYFLDFYQIQDPIGQYKECLKTIRLLMTPRGLHDNWVKRVRNLVKKLIKIESLRTDCQKIGANKFRECYLVELAALLREAYACNGLDGSKEAWEVHYCALETKVKCIYSAENTQLQFDALQEQEALQAKFRAEKKCVIDDCDPLESAEIFQGKIDAFMRRGFQMQQMAGIEKSFCDRYELEDLDQALEKALTDAQAFDLDSDIYAMLMQRFQALRPEIIKYHEHVREYCAQFARRQNELASVYAESRRYWGSRVVAAHTIGLQNETNQQLVAAESYLKQIAHAHPVCEKMFTRILQNQAQQCHAALGCHEFFSQEFQNEIRDLPTTDKLKHIFRRICQEVRDCNPFFWGPVAYAAYKTTWVMDIIKLLQDADQAILSQISDRLEKILSHQRVQSLHLTAFATPVSVEIPNETSTSWLELTMRCKLAKQFQQLCHQGVLLKYTLLEHDEIEEPFDKKNLEYWQQRVINHPAAYDHKIAVDAIFKHKRFKFLLNPDSSNLSRLIARVNASRVSEEEPLAEKLLIPWSDIVVSYEDWLKHTVTDPIRFKKLGELNWDLLTYDRRAPLEESASDIETIQPGAASSCAAEEESPLKPSFTGLMAIYINDYAEYEQLRKFQHEKWDQISRNLNWLDRVGIPAAVNTDASYALLQQTRSQLQEVSEEFAQLKKEREEACARAQAEYDRAETEFARAEEKKTEAEAAFVRAEEEKSSYERGKACTLILSAQAELYVMVLTGARLHELEQAFDQPNLRGILVKFLVDAMGHWYLLNKKRNHSMRIKLSENKQAFWNAAPTIQMALQRSNESVKIPPDEAEQLCDLLIDSTKEDVEFELLVGSAKESLAREVCRMMPSCSMR